jgi:hypothetical protein
MAVQFALERVSSLVWNTQEYFGQRNNRYSELRATASKQTQEKIEMSCPRG